MLKPHPRRQLKQAGDGDLNFNPPGDSKTLPSCRRTVSTLAVVTYSWGGYSLPSESLVAGVPRCWCFYKEWSMMNHMDRAVWLLGHLGAQVRLCYSVFLESPGSMTFG